VDDKGLAPAAGPALLPNLLFDTGEAVADTTPIIQRLEALHERRKVYPSDGGMAFLNKILEDYADEWHTKHMFHYRWWFAPDTQRAGRILPLFGDHTVDEDIYKATEEFIVKRQVARVSQVTGSNELTAPVIEESYRTMLRTLNSHFAAGNRFLFGDRPSSADFAFYGQFTCLALFDPTPTMIAEELAPRAVGYTLLLEDASGCAVDEAQWTKEVSPTLRSVLAEAGRLYAPFMVANAQAVADKKKQIDTTLDGKPYQANAFPYQAKCLRWLREEYGQLTEHDKAFVDEAISGTGLEVMFQEQSLKREMKSNL